MKQVLSICAAIWLVGGVSGAACAQERGSAASAATEPAESTSRSEGVPIERIIAAVAKKTGKRYLIDARVHGPVEILGQDISAISYSDFLSILQLAGYTAVEGSNYVSVIPQSIVRQMPLPLAMGKDKYPEAQYVTRVIPVKNLPAATLVPILRPLLPTHGHLAAVVCGNALVMVDSFANVERIEKLVVSLDVGKPYLPRPCESEPMPAGNAPHP
jgi:type II secretory pathway component GspD/PulD (secretin)